MTASDLSETVIQLVAVTNTGGWQGARGEFSAAACRARVRRDQARTANVTAGYRRLPGPPDRDGVADHDLARERRRNPSTDLSPRCAQQTWRNPSIRRLATIELGYQDLLRMNFSGYEFKYVLHHIERAC